MFEGWEEARFLRWVSAMRGRKLMKRFRSFILLAKQKTVNEAWRNIKLQETQGIYTLISQKYGRYFDPHHPSEHRCRPNTPPHGGNLLRYFGWKRKRALESSIAAPSSTITTLPRQDVLLLGQFFFWLINLSFSLWNVRKSGKISNFPEPRAISLLVRTNGFLVFSG